MKKLTLLAAGAVGYVLGTRAGRERYEQIKSRAGRIASDPRVRAKASEAGHVIKEQAPVVKDKVVDAAGAAKDKVSGSSSNGTTTSQSTSGSTSGSTSDSTSDSTAGATAGTATGAPTGAP